MRVPMDTAQQTLLEQRPALARLARSLIGDEAEDVLQEAWIAAGDGRSIDRPAGWLRTVIRRTAGKRHRSRIRRNAREHQAARPESVPGGESLVDGLEVQQQALAALHALEEPYRGVLILRYLHDQSPRRIAAQLDRPVATVKSQLQRGLQKLREQLDARHGGSRRRWQLGLAPLLAARTAPLATTLGALALLVGIGAGGAFAIDAWQSGDPAATATEAEGLSASAHEKGARLRGRAAPDPRPGPTPTPDPEVAPEAQRARLDVSIDFRGTPRVDLTATIRSHEDGKERTLHVPAGRHATIEDLPAGWYLVAGKSGAGTTCNERRVLLRPGQATLARLECFGARVLEGQVRRRDGQPVSGARVEVIADHKYPIYDDAMGASAWRTRTDRAGRFRLPTVPASTTLTVLANAPGLATHTRTVEPSHHQALELVLEDGGTIEGTVRDPKGRAIGGALVFVAPPVHGEIRAWLDTPWPSNWPSKEGATAIPWWLDPQNGEVGPNRPPWILGTRADAQGRYRLRHVHLEFAYRLTAVHPDWLRSPDQRVMLASEQPHARVDPVVRAHGTLALEVLDPAGRPVGNQRIDVDGRHFANTDGEGLVERHRVPQGEKALWIWRKDVGWYAGSLAVTSDEAQQTVTLQSGHRLRGQVLDLEGKPVAGAGIRISWPQTTRSVEGHSDEAGRFDIGPLPAGTVHLQCWSRKIRNYPKLDAVEIPGPALELRPTHHAEVSQGQAVYRFRFQYPENTPAPPYIEIGILGFGAPQLADLFSQLEGDERWSLGEVGLSNARQHEGGAAEIAYHDGLRGKYPLGIVAPGFVGQVFAPNTLQPDAAVEVQMQPARQVRCRVVSPDGRPIQGARVAADPSQVHASVTLETDGNGIVELPYLPTRAIRVAVSARGFASDLHDVPREAESPHTIRMRRGGRLAVLVRDRKGNAVEAPSIELRRSETGPVERRYALDDASRLLIDLPPGTWWVGTPDAPFTEVEVKVGELATTRVLASEP